MSNLMIANSHIWLYRIGLDQKDSESQISYFRIKKEFKLVNIEGSDGV